MNDMLNITKPWKHGKWLIWNHTVLNRIYLSDCDDTINGICLKDKTVKQCLSECIGECGAGYHIDFGNGKTICVPIRTDIHDKLNPAYRLRKQSMYPEFDRNVKVSTFINTEKYPFPPNNANVVFYQDILTMINTNNGYSLGNNINEQIENGSVIYMESGNDLNIQLLPASMSAVQIIQYKPVLFGDYVQLSIPNTSLVAEISVSISNELQWSSNLPQRTGNNLAFRIMPINNKRKIGDILTYSDFFALTADNSVIVLDTKYNYLVSSFDDFYDVTNNKDITNTFQFVSKMTGYYCENKKCKSIPIKDIQTNQESGLYKGFTVERQPSCFGACKYNNALSTGPTSYRIFLYVIGIIIMILVIIFLLSKKYWKSKKSI